MALVVSEIIDEARDYHAAFSPKAIPDKMLFRVLSRIERRIYRMVMEQADEVLVTREVINAATIQAALDADAGIALPEHMLVGNPARFVLEDGQGEGPIDIIASVHEYERFPAAWVEGRALWLVDLRKSGLTDKHGWEKVETIELPIILTPPLIDAPADELTLPDSTRDAFVEACVLFMAARAGVMPGIDRAAAEASVATAVAELIRQSQVGSWRVRRY